MRIRYLTMKFLRGLGVGFGIGAAVSLGLLGLGYAVLRGMLGG